MAKVNSSSSLHFTLTSANVSTNGTAITGGRGDLARPDQIEGSFSVTVSGFIANVMVASKGGVFEALLPFQRRYQITKPSAYGLTDPSQLMNQETGVAKLLAVAQGARVTRPERLVGELLDTVAFSVPGSDIPVLPDAKPAVPVELVAAINPKTYELRQIQLTGPLTSPTSNCTYVLTLTNYDEHVNITLPPTS
jgi:lipoprotein LprG